MKKRAFTLTELLVVVVIIGVLSAVVLPKFIKIIETRKTTEAENIMAAVRNEQEARCMLGKNYTASTTELASLPKRTSGNYEYTLQLQGITATSKGGSYQLKIQSYADGGICCSDVETGGCEKLNKNYPICSASTPSTSVCAVPGPGAVCEVPGETTQTDTQRCGCTNSGTKEGTRTFDSVACEWGDWTWGSCSEQETNCPSCTEGETSGSRICNICGTRTTQLCVDGRWTDSLGECSIGDATNCLQNDGCDPDTKPVSSQACGCTGTQQRTVKCLRAVEQGSVGEWITSMWGECEGDDPNQCNTICPNTPQDMRECTPGESKKDGTNTCYLPKGSGSMYELTENISQVDVSEVAGSSEPANLGNLPAPHLTQQYESIDLGYYCDNNCRWQAFACERHGGGGSNAVETQAQSYTIVTTDPPCTIHIHEEPNGERWATGSCY